MEDEIDLRPYIEAVLKHWYWIVGVAILAGIVGFGIGSFLSPSYQATALVAVSIPQDLALTSLTQDDLAPNFVTQNKALPYLRAFPELATSDQILLELYKSIDPPLEDINSVGDLRGLLDAQSGSDPNLIRLTVTHNDPEIASRVVNKWAELFVPMANRVFGQTDEERIIILEDQLEAVRIELENAEEALIEFQANNRALILNNNLNFHIQKQATLLEDRSALQQLKQNVLALQAQIESLPRGNSVSLAHQLTGLHLQLRAFDAENNSPLQLQFNEGIELISSDRNRQIEFLRMLVGSLDIQISQIEAELNDLEPKILTLQQQLQESETQHNRFTRGYNEAEETYTALARKVESERLSIEDTSTGVKLASNSVTNYEPTSTSRWILLIIAAGMGGMLTLLVLWTNTWWQNMTNN